MIGLILGTSEGKKILSLLNKFTEDIFISTATEYGGQLLKDYKYAHLNTTPMDLEKLKSTILEKNIKILVDASHPYALEITKNCMEACNCLGIEYIRYERASCIEMFKEFKNIIEVKDYEELENKLKNIKGNILNTSGSRNIHKILDMKLENRIIHRVLPSVKVITECIEKGVKIEDIIALKGPISYQLNSAFIKEYNAKALILKDSGIEGGTYEKLKACIDEDIYALVVDRKTIHYDKVFNSVDSVVEYIKGII